MAAKKVAKKVVKEVSEVSEFKVFNERLELVRVYSVEVHGENAKELAEEFVTKQGLQGKVLVIN